MPSPAPAAQPPSATLGAGARDPSLPPQPASPALPSPSSSSTAVPPSSSTLTPSTPSSFLNTTPTPVLRFLTAYSSLIHGVAWAREVYLWKEGRRAEALVVLGGWWAVCVGLGPFIRFGLPLLLVYYLHPFPLDISLLSRIPWLNLPPPSAPASTTATSRRAQSLPPASPASLSKTLAALSLLHQPPPMPTFQLLTTPSPPKLTWKQTLRVTALLYPLWLLAMFLIPLPVVLALSGTLLLTWHAPFSLAARQLLASSGLVRFLCSRAWGMLIGERGMTWGAARARAGAGADGDEKEGTKGRRESFRSLRVAFGVSSKDEKGSKEEKEGLLGADKEKERDQAKEVEDERVGEEVPVPPMRFRFDVWENQRWWMGLDWTTALLPSDPAPYTTLLPLLASPSAGSAPAAPAPSTLPLPSPSQTVLPHPTNPALQVVRKALWTWEDAEWRVLVRREGGGEGERVAMQLPELDGTEKGGGAKGRVEELVKRARGRTGTASSSSSAAEGQGDAEHDPEEDDLPGERHPRAGAGEGEGEEQWETDEAGWVYCDNKWQSRGGKGGMGKYTRSRRWTRVGLCHETVEVVRAPTAAAAAGKPTTLPRSAGRTGSFTGGGEGRRSGSLQRGRLGSPNPVASPARASPPTPNTAGQDAYPASVASGAPYNIFSAFSSPSNAGPHAPSATTAPTVAETDVWARGELDPPPAAVKSSIDRPPAPVGRMSIDSLPPGRRSLEYAAAGEERAGTGGVRPPGSAVRRDSLESYGLPAGGAAEGGGGRRGSEGEKQGLRARLKGVVQKSS